MRTYRVMAGRWTLTLLATVALAACQRETPPPAKQQSAGAAPTPAAATTPARPTPPTKKPVLTQAPLPAGDYKAGEPLRAAYVRGLLGLPGMAAQKRGWFKTHGLTVEFKEELADSREAARVLQRGDCQVVFGVSLPVALDIERRDPGRVKIIGFIAETADNRLTGFLVPKDSDAQKTADLRKRRIAVSGADYAGWAARFLLMRELGSADAFTVVATPAGMSFGDTGAPDALFAAEIELARATRQMGVEHPARVIEDAPLARRLGEPFLVGAVVVRSEIVSVDEEMADRFLAAQNELMLWCNNNFHELMPDMQKDWKLDDETVLNLYAPKYLRIADTSNDDQQRAVSFWLNRPPGSQAGPNELTLEAMLIILP